MKPAFTTTEDLTLFNSGYDRGSYAAAYENGDWYKWHRKLGAGWPVAYLEGVVLGFFSSYELKEVPPGIRGQVKALSAKHGWEE